MKPGDLIMFRPFGTMSREFGLVIEILMYRPDPIGYSKNYDVFELRILTHRGVCDMATTRQDFEVVHAGGAMS